MGWGASGDRDCDGQAQDTMKGNPMKCDIRKISVDPDRWAMSVWGESPEEKESLGGLISSGYSGERVVSLDEKDGITLILTGEPDGTEDWWRRAKWYPSHVHDPDLTEYNETEQAEYYSSKKSAWITAIASGKMKPDPRLGLPRK